MAPDSIYLLIVLAVALLATFRDWVRLDIAALLLLLSLVMPWKRGPDGVWRGILESDEAFSGFGSPAVVMIASIFVLSCAMERTGAARRIGRRLLEKSARTELRLLAGVLVLGTLFSAFVSDTTTVLVWMPLLIAVARERRFSAPRLLLPLAYAALLGGQWTLIGTRVNIVASDFLRAQQGMGFGFFAFTPVAACVWVGCVAYILLLGRRLLPAARHPSLTRRYQVTEYLTEVMATPAADMVGRALADLDLGEGATVLGVVRGGENLAPAKWLVVEPGDVLILQGGLDRIADVLSRPGMTVQEELRLGATTLRSVDLRMVEGIIVPGSSLEGRTLAESDFLKDHDASVLAVGRRGHPLTGSPREQRLEVGDSLLIVGHTEVIERLENHPDVNLMTTRPLPLHGKAWVALGWMAALIVSTSTGLLDPTVAFVSAAVGCVVTGCVSVREAYRSIDWRVVVLLGSMIPYGLALERTGTAAQLARGVAAGVGDLGPGAVFAAFLFVTVVLTQILENSAAAVVLAPVAFELALSVGADPRAFLLGMAITCSAGFATPMAHECTLLVMAPGGYRFRDFLVLGVPLALITWGVTSFLLPILVPLVPLAD
ncbi:MAG TPA: SLC13 family permease [Planctomycetes bacterium]|nr:SLC13 family permease [Planctomycetota bacterium]